VMGTEPWTGKIRVKAGTNYAATWVSWEEAVEEDRFPHLVFAPALGRLLN